MLENRLFASLTVPFEKVKTQFYFMIGSNLSTASLKNVAWIYDPKASMRSTFIRYPLPRALDQVLLSYFFVTLAFIIQSLVLQVRAAMGVYFVKSS